MGFLELIHQVDVAVYKYLNSLAGDWLVDRIVAAEESNHLLKGGLFLTLYWYAWFRPGVAQGRRRLQIVTVFMGTLGSLVVARLLATFLPFRVRPMFEHGLPHMSFAVPLRPNMEAWSAFPSDTATFFFALAFGMTFLMRRVGVALLIYAATWICIPRLYIGLHYTTDIVAGAALGILIVRFALRSEWVEECLARPLLELSETRPEWFYGGGFLLSMEMANLFDSTRSLLHGLNRAIRVGPHHVFVTIVVSVAVMILVAAGATYAWRRRIHRERVTIIAF